MKKSLLAAGAIALAAAFYFLGTASGAGSLVRWASSLFLPAPLEFASARPSGVGHVELTDAAIDLPEVRLSADGAAAALGFGRVDTRFRNVRIRPKHGVLQKLELNFISGEIAAIYHPDRTELRFRGWNSPQIRFEGECFFNGKNVLTKLHAKGEADLKLLGSLFSRQTSAESSPPVPFEVRYGEGTFEVHVNGKLWLRSNWTMRR